MNERINKNKSLGIYIHIPFCKKKCDYCDFYSIANANATLKQDYVNALIKEIEINSKVIKDKYVVDTIYFGGGTPIFLNDDNLDCIINTIYKNFNCNIKEASIECNPSLLNTEKIQELKSLNFSRISLGIQTFNKNSLNAVGRFRDESINLENLITNLSNIFPSISADLMLGLPFSTKENLLNDLSKVVSCGVNHISAYSLKVEKNTPLEFNVNNCKIILPDNDFQADLYEILYNFLIEKGFYLYEVSNFSKPEFECLHNLKYWQRQDYLGIGSSAHSLVDNIRYNNIYDIDKYISILTNQSFQNNIDNKLWQLKENIENLNEKDINIEYIMLGLRTKYGININTSIINIIKKGKYKDCFNFNNNNISIKDIYMYSMNSLINYVLDIV